MMYTDLVCGKEGLITAKALLYLSKICGSPVVLGEHTEHTFTAPVTVEQFNHAVDMLFRIEGKPEVKHKPQSVSYAWKLPGDGRLVFTNDIRARHIFTISIVAKPYSKE